MTSLARILEPEVMDSAEEARDYDAMDHRQVNQVFVGDFLPLWDAANPVLDTGTGTALIPIELCRQHPAAQVIALDASQAMLALGQVNVERAALAARIRLQHGDAKQMPFRDGAFGGVISNSIVHHIHEPILVLREMVRVLAPGGLLFVRDLLRPVDETTLRALVGLHAAGANDRQRQLFADSLHAALSLEELRGLVARIGFDPAEVRQTTDRHWTWIARKPG